MLRGKEMKRPSLGDSILKKKKHSDVKPLAATLNGDLYKGKLENVKFADKIKGIAGSHCGDCSFCLSNYNILFIWRMFI